MAKYHLYIPHIDAGTPAYYLQEAPRHRFSPEFEHRGVQDNAEQFVYEQLEVFACTKLLIALERYGV